SLICKQNLLLRKSNHVVFNWYTTSVFLRAVISCNKVVSFWNEEHELWDNLSSKKLLHKFQCVIKVFMVILIFLTKKIKIQMLPFSCIKKCRFCFSN
ncbi:hypothetical protein L9F63_013123, partial [Diploptera punctata]